MNDAKAAPAARVGAATALLYRGWGRPAQTISASIEGNELIDDGLLGSINDLLDQISAGKVIEPENTRESASPLLDVCRCSPTLSNTKDEYVLPTFATSGRPPPRLGKPTRSLAHTTEIALLSAPGYQHE